MPRDGSGVYSVPPGTEGAPNTTILSAAYNAFLSDLVADLNAARPVSAGGTGGNSAITGWDGLATKGTDIASASSINLNTATGPSLTITGTATIATVTLAEGKVRLVRAGGAFTLDASANLLVNGSSTTDLTVTAEDLLLFRGGASSVVSVARLNTVPNFAQDVVITSTDAGAGAGPLLTLYRNSASPAASDAMGQIQFSGKDAGGNETVYALLRAAIDDPTDASEDASLSLQAIVAGTMTEHVKAGGGIVELVRGRLKFPGTQVPSADANTLDDYKEDAWVPVIAFGGSSTGVTYSAQTGRYVKIGRQVWFSGRIELTNNGSGTGAATISGLPHPVSGVFRDGFVTVGFWTNCSAIVGNLTGYVANGATTITLQMSGATGSVAPTDTNITNTAVLGFSGFYFVAD
jgi:hypothetical protein